MSSKAVYVSDTNIWIDFQHAALLPALFQLPFQLCTTDFALGELSLSEQRMLRSLGLVVEVLDAAATPRLAALMSEHNNSSLPDVSCYLLARDNQWPLLTGDGRLRRQAERDKLRVHGALWLLDQLVDADVITPMRAAAALQAMLQKSARLPQTECDRRMARWRA
jgi:hypothetical protein